MITQNAGLRALKSELRPQAPDETWFVRTGLTEELASVALWTFHRGFIPHTDYPMKSSTLYVSVISLFFDQESCPQDLVCSPRS